MIRTLLSILLAAALAAAAVSFSYVTLWFVFFSISLSAGIVVGVPAIWFAKRQGWLSWWHAAIAGGLAATPWIFFYLVINPGHTQVAGLYNGIGLLGLGVSAGVLVWIMGIFRNHTFGDVCAPFPGSLALLIPLFGAGYFYRDALEPIPVYGCITSYAPSEQPTAWHYADVEVKTDEGERFIGEVTIGAADPASVGSCAHGYKSHSFTLQSTRYFFSGTTTVGCKFECDHSEGA